MQQSSILVTNYVSKTYDNCKLQAPEQQWLAQFAAVTRLIFSDVDFAYFYVSGNTLCVACRPKGPNSQRHLSRLLEIFPDAADRLGSKGEMVRIDPTKDISVFSYSTVIGSFYC